VWEEQACHGLWNNMTGMIVHMRIACDVDSSTWSSPHDDEPRAHFMVWNCGGEDQVPPLVPDV
jgi:hypothetical protein